MKRLEKLALIGAAFAGALTAASAGNAAILPNLMPLPREATFTNSALPLSGPLQAVPTGCEGTLVPDAITRFQHDLHTLVGIDLSGKPLALAIRCLGHNKISDIPDQHEGYRLTTSPTGIDIEADSEIAVLRALATLRQLVDTHTGTPSIIGAHIEDAPRFLWRGIMVDTARHFMTVDTLKRQIVAMELTKLNVLHLHLSDQTFRVQSLRFPKLTAANPDGQFYTQAQIRDLVTFATDHGVRIVPEIDMPAHTAAIVSAYPEFGAEQIDPKDPRGTDKIALDPVSEKTYQFLDVLLKEMTGLFPDPFIHTGGDELTPFTWQNSKTIAAFKAKNHLVSNSDLQGYFVDRLHKLLGKYHKTMVGWDEIGLNALPKDTVVEAWRTSNPVYTDTAKGNRVVVAAGYYLDLQRPAQNYYGVDPTNPNAFSTMSQQMFDLSQKNPASSALINPYLVAKPMPPLTPEQEKLVLGGDAPLWSEGITDEMLDTGFWPRAAAIAERFWSPKDTRDPDDMLRRLIPTQIELQTLGLHDQENRNRMIARMTTQTQPVETLMGAVAPLRNYAHLRTRLMNPNAKMDFVSLADAASTDSLESLHFEANVKTYLKGDTARLPLLKTQLEEWRDNDAAYAEVAKENPFLRAALPTSANLAQLAAVGLTALDALQTGGKIDREDAKQADALLAKLRDQEAASADLAAIASHSQPPADLLIRVTAPVEQLYRQALQSR